MAQTQRPVLAAQTALVTGANSGIGRAVTIALGRVGANVLVNYVTDAGRRNGGRRDPKVWHERAGVSGRRQRQSADCVMLQLARREFGTLDIVVANAGVQDDAPVGDMTLAQWNKVLSVNLTGQFLCARAAIRIREFRRRRLRPDVSCAFGKIIWMSSVHQVIPWARHVNYAAAKGGIMMMMPVSPRRRWSGSASMPSRRVPSARPSIAKPGKRRPLWSISSRWSPTGELASRRISLGWPCG
jgi:glucose 1-dehydrogenase